jgi:hypothetical protein
MLASKRCHGPDGQRVRVPARDSAHQQHVAAPAARPAAGPEVCERAVTSRRQPEPEAADQQEALIRHRGRRAVSRSRAAERELARLGGLALMSAARWARSYRQRRPVFARKDLLPGVEAFRRPYRPPRADAIPAPRQAAPGAAGSKQRASGMIRSIEQSAGAVATHSYFVSPLRRPSARSRDRAARRRTSGGSSRCGCRRCGRRRRARRDTWHP